MHFLFKLGGILNLKKFMLFLLILIICIAGIIYYYFAPLSLSKVIRHGDSIDKIIIYNYMENREQKNYDTSIDDAEEINEIKRIFDSFKYNRSVNQGGYITNKVLFMDVYYKKNREKFDIYSLTIYDAGYVVIGKMNNKKTTFKVKDNEAEQLIDRIVHWANEKQNR